MNPYKNYVVFCLDYSAIGYYLATESALKILDIVHHLGIPFERYTFRRILFHRRYVDRHTEKLY